ncbi:MFS transporter [Piscinibacter sakaiensis]|nr:MFS transporter [Piscinibacter sakaiensis]
MPEASVPPTPAPPRHVVPWIAAAQLFGTSLWFSANSAADDLARRWGLATADIGHLTVAVQAGFIAGTLLLALSGLADRFRASRIFVACALLGAAANAGFALLSGGLADALAWRFVVGLTLAGIYPLGMKLIIGWAPGRAGAALAVLVGMLVIGTALPHLLRALGQAWDGRLVILASSGLALVSAAMVGRLGDGPHQAPSPARGPAARPMPAQLLAALRVPAFRAAALGYFGHMWELYAFWTLVPMLLARSSLGAAGADLATLSFAVIAVGGLGCFAGGLASTRWGSARVAAAALAGSGGCALVFAAGGHAWAPLPLALLLLAWGTTVVADSPHFSALSARASPPALVGSALAVQNGIGFALTLGAIALVTGQLDRVGPAVVWWLVPGPLLGLLGLWPLWRPGRPPPPG